MPHRDELLGLQFMTDALFKFSTQDIALSQVLIDCARVQGGDEGEPVSAEELAVFVERGASGLPDPDRAQQILLQLANNPELYEDWLLLAEFCLPEATAADKATIDNNAGTRQQVVDSVESGKSTAIEFLRSLFDLRVGFAALVGVLCTLLAVQVFTPDDRIDPGLVVHDARLQPQKATLTTADGQTTTASATATVQQWIQCVALQASNSGQLCYSNTPGVQHWLLQQPSGAVLAIKPLVNADKIDNIVVAGNYLLLDFQLAGSFHLALYTLNAEGSGSRLEPTMIFSDATNHGYFDQVKLDTKALTYTLSVAGEQPVSKRYEFNDSR